MCEDIVEMPFLKKISYGSAPMYGFSRVKKKGSPKAGFACQLGDVIAQACMSYAHVLLDIFWVAWINVHVHVEREVCQGATCWL